VQAPAAGPDFDALSPRELEIMRLLAKGSSLAEIAEAIGVGYKTVANTPARSSPSWVSRAPPTWLRLSIEAGVS